MSWTLTTSGASISKAGVGANSDIVISGAILAKWSDESEGTICVSTMKDWITDYSTIKTNYKPILSELSSDMIAMRIVSYDLSGYFKTTEAQTLLDVLRDNIIRNLEVLKNQDTQDRMI